MAGKVIIKDFSKTKEIVNPANPEQYIVYIMGRCERDAQPLPDATGTYYLERGKMGTFQTKPDGSFELIYEIWGTTSKSATITFTVAVQVEDSGFIWREYHLPALRSAAVATASTPAAGPDPVPDPTPPPSATAPSPAPPTPVPAQSAHFPCIHCEETGECTKGETLGYTHSCSYCQKKAGMDSDMFSLVPCAYCGGVGKHFPPKKDEPKKESQRTKDHDENRSQGKRG